MREGYQLFAFTQELDPNLRFADGTRYRQFGSLLVFTGFRKNGMADWDIFSQCIEAPEMWEKTLHIPTELYIQFHDSVQKSFPTRIVTVFCQYVVIPDAEDAPDAPDAES